MPSPDLGVHMYRWGYSLRFSNASLALSSWRTSYASWTAVNFASASWLPWFLSGCHLLLSVDHASRQKMSRMHPNMCDTMQYSREFIKINADMSWKHDVGCHAGYDMFPHPCSSLQKVHATQLTWAQVFCKLFWLPPAMPLSRDRERYRDWWIRQAEPWSFRLQFFDFGIFSSGQTDRVMSDGKATGRFNGWLGCRKAWSSEPNYAPWAIEIRILGCF